MDLEQAKQKAKNYVDKYDKDFCQNINMKLVSSELIDRGSSGKEYRFVWQEIIGEAYTLNYVAISVNPNTGELIKYQAIHRPLTISIDPKVSKDEAIGIAITQFSELDMNKLNECTAQLKVINDNKNSQKLVWDVKLTEVKDYIYGGYVYVDAMAGDTILVNPYK